MPRQNLQDEALSVALRKAIRAAQAVVERHADDCDCSGVCEVAAGMLFTLESFLAAVDSSLIITPTLRLRWAEDSAAKGVRA
jgi:hypothetical protein